MENWAGAAGWCLSLVTGAGRSGDDRPGQRDFGRSGNVGAKTGPEMRARVRGWSGQAGSLVESGGGDSHSSFRLPSSHSAAPTSGLPER